MSICRAHTHQKTNGQKNKPAGADVMEEFHDDDDDDDDDDDEEDGLLERIWRNERIGKEATVGDRDTDTICS